MPGYFATNDLDTFNNCFMLVADSNQHLTTGFTFRILKFKNVLL